MSELEQIRASFRPERITTLFVAESPPHGGTFFYKGDSQLYRNVKGCLGPAENFLRGFQASGFFLDDLVLHPVNQLEDRERDQHRWDAVASLAQRIKAYQPRAVVILMSSIEPMVSKAMAEAGLGDIPRYVTRYPNAYNLERFKSDMAGIIPKIPSAKRNDAPGQNREALNTNTVAIIGGTGPEGRGLALRWARAGLKVIIGSRSLERARATAQEVAKAAGASARVEGMENAAAVASSAVVVLTVPFEAQASTLKGLKSAFRPDSVLLCATVPLAAAVGDRVSRLLGVWQGSAAEQAAELVPDGVKVAGAFHNISASLLESDHEVECDVIVCADDPQARQAAFELARKIPGVRPVDGGRLENSRIVEALTALLIGINLRYKGKHSGLRITGLNIED